MSNRLELLKQIKPTLKRVAILWDPRTLTAATFKSMFTQLQHTARSLDVKVHAAEARRAADIDIAFSRAVRKKTEALIVVISPMFNAHRKRLIALAADYRLPAIYEWKEFVNDGGLISYGADLADIYRRAAGFVDRILRGASPSQLAIEHPTKVDLAVNLSTARALGLTIPQWCLERPS